MQSPEASFRKREIIPHHQIRNWEVIEGVLAIEAPSGDAYKCIGFLGKGDFVSRSIVNVEFELRCLEEVRLVSTSFDSVPITQIQDALAFTMCITGTKVEERLFNLLLYLSQKIGKVTDEGIEIARVPQELYASCIGSTRVTITRSLQILESQGRIKKGKMLTLLDKGSFLVA